MENLIVTARKNQERAWEVLSETDVMNIWKSIGAEPHLVGSLRNGLLTTHLDIDIHIYSSPLKIADSFAAMAKLAENPRITKLFYGNLINTEEQCIEWHAEYRYSDSETWSIDMIHILKGSLYDGHFEKMADRICSVMDEKQKQMVMLLKHQTPEADKIPGVYYYIAVLEGKVCDYAQFRQWLDQNPDFDTMSWMP